MQVQTGNPYGISMIVKRALEGRISPLNFLLILGFISSMVLMYISLHMYNLGLSQDIGDCRDKLKTLQDQNARLIADYNDLVSPERIIPLAQEIGLRAGMQTEMKRLALYENERNRDRLLATAQAVLAEEKEKQVSGPESR